MKPPSFCRCPIRCLTPQPGFHWFGYYDKLQFDPTGRYVLCMETDFEGRSPTIDDRIRFGMIDLADGDRWIPLGETGAWCWQQGCMLQWRPGSTDEIVYNDRAGDGFRAHILNVRTGARRTIPFPVYALGPDGRSAVSLDFLRTGRLRPGYGYAGRDPGAQDPAPADQGLYRVDLETGDHALILSLAQAAAIPSSDGDWRGYEQWFNHLLFSPGGRRFIFLHRRLNANGSIWTRMFTADPDGGHPRLLHDGGNFSHFIWRDDRHILAWAKRPESDAPHFYLIDEQAGTAEAVGPDAMRADGHCTYLPDRAWIVNDTYPAGPDRLQPLYLFHPATGRRNDIGGFRLPEAYTHEWRCDLHPRHSPAGRFLTIDSAHEGRGRQLYLLDIGGVHP